MKTPRGVPRECSRQRIGRSHECTPRGAVTSGRRVAERGRGPSLGSRQRRFSHLLSAPSRRRVNDDEQSPRIARGRRRGRSVRGERFFAVRVNPVAADTRKGRGGRGNRFIEGLNTRGQVDTRGGAKWWGFAYTRCNHV